MQSDCDLDLKFQLQELIPDFVKKELIPEQQVA
uniref:Uncharacterized protein n=1 Tax=Arundo donax TaxID=35708 RepID=A0A0A9GVI5_ARUDO